MRLLLIDNSVWQRLAREKTVGDWLRQAVGGSSLICISTMLKLEAGFSARSPADHAQLLQALSAFRLLELDPKVDELAVELQQAMWQSGNGRAAGAFDLLSAALAIRHDVTLVHYDKDFELISEVDPRFRSQWVVPRGTID